jgi:hypothetical protein
MMSWPAASCVTWSGSLSIEFGHRQATPRPARFDNTIRTQYGDLSVERYLGSRNCHVGCTRSKAAPEKATVPYGHLHCLLRHIGGLIDFWQTDTPWRLLKLADMIHLRDYTLA